jgi:hypothetical protein
VRAVKLSIATAYLWIVFGPFGVFCLAWACIYIARGEYLSAVVAIGFASFTLGLVLMLAIVASRKVKPRVQREDGAIMLRPDRRVDNLLMASTFGAFLGMAVYAIFAPLDMIAIRVPRNDERFFVFACGAAVLVGVYSLRQIIRRRGTSYVRMTVDGLELGNTVNSAERMWDEVTDVADRPRQARQPTGTTYITTADGRTRTLPSDWYTPGGRALRDLVRFYWQHSERREELTDGRAAERLDAESRGTT